MNRRTFIGSLAGVGALGAASGCLSQPLRSHPLPPARGRVVRTSVTAVRDGDGEDVLLTATPDEVDLAETMRRMRAETATAGGDGSDGGDSTPTFAVPPALHTALLDEFDDVRYYLTVDHRCRIRVYGVEPGDRLRYRTRPEVFRRVVPADHALFTIRPAGSPYFQNTNAVLREGTVLRKRLRVGPKGDPRTVLTVTPDGIDRGDGGGDASDVSLPLSHEQLELLRGRFEAVRLVAVVEHTVGDGSFTRSYYADRQPFNRLTPGRTTQFAVETTSSDSAAAGRITTLDPDSPFYDDQPW